MRKLLREPLLHFMLLGLGLFLLHGWMVGHSNGSGDKIVITQGRIEQLGAGFARMHQRAPDAGELEALIDDAIREDIFYREAKALGLDQDDTIVRRRLRQKLEFVSEDVSPVREPTGAELQAYLSANPDKFRSESRYSLSQVYLNPAMRGQRLVGDAQSVLAQLRRAGPDADPSRLGDAFLLEHHFGDATASELARLFGARFVTTLRTLPTGEWQGPVASGYGVHLVYVGRRETGRVPALQSVREQVRREWVHDQRQQANERFYAELRKRYEVTVESPGGGGGGPALALGARQ